MTAPKLTREIALLKKVNQSGSKKPSKAQGDFSRRAPSPRIMEALKNMPEMHELENTEKDIRHADRNDIYSLATVMRACRKWKAFYEVSSNAEEQVAQPYFSHFAVALKGYISYSPQERAIPALQDFAELIQIDMALVSSFLTELCADPREDVSRMAFRALEKNTYLLLNSMDLYSKKSNSLVEPIGTILETYAKNAYISPESTLMDAVNGDSRHPHPPNEEIATSIATYLFFQKEGLLRSQEGMNMLPYAISWSSEHYDTDKIDFMIDTLSGLPRGFRKEILLKVVIFANSEPIRECALDLLVDMGVHSVKSELELGGMEDTHFVNRMLMQKFTETYGRFADNIVMPTSSLVQ